MSNLTFLEDYALKEADLAASLSDDPKTQVGAVVLDNDGTVLLKGANRLSALRLDGFTDAYLHAAKDREQRVHAPLKDFFMEHAERNLIFAAARRGIKLEGLTIGVNWFPCAPCARAIVQVGIKKLIGRQPDFDHPRYGEDFKKAMTILREGGVQISYEEPFTQ